MNGMEKDEGTVSRLINAIVLSGLIYISLCLIGIPLPLISLAMYFARGIGHLIFLLNVIALILIILKGRKHLSKGDYIKNLLMCIVFLIVYPMVYDIDSWTTK